MATTQFNKETPPQTKQKAESAIPQPKPKLEPAFIQPKPKADPSFSQPKPKVEPEELPKFDKNSTPDQMKEFVRQAFMKKRNNNIISSHEQVAPPKFS